MKILLHFIAKLGRENIFKLTIGNENLCQVSNDNGVRIVNFATPKNLVFRAQCSLTGTFITTPAPSLMGRLTTRLNIY
jgi:hypothetical protein